jgi:hypothetical protein
MQASVDEANAGFSTLEAEAAAWSSRRTSSPGAAIGKVRVVRIRKRCIPNRPPMNGKASADETGG